MSTRPSWSCRLQVKVKWMEIKRAPRTKHAVLVVLVKNSNYPEFHAVQVLPLSLHNFTMTVDILRLDFVESCKRYFSGSKTNRH